MLSLCNVGSSRKVLDTVLQDRSALPTPVPR
jgi:hypothetical protein